MLLESPSVNWKDYELIDSGNFEKLERFGPYTMIRPEPKALWNKSLSEDKWKQMAHTQFITGAGFGKAGKEDSGTWKRLKRMNDQWVISYNNAPSFKLRLGLTSFKHVGVFPEQAPNWDFIYNSVNELKESVAQPKVLNLFAYTGAASLAARCSGAIVTHLDSVKQVVTWARTNMELSGLENVRWILEDALKFVKREVRRGNLYNGIILDPPAYGHGPDGEKWKLDECLFDILQNCAQIMAPKNSFLVLNLYSNGYSSVLAQTLVKCAFNLTEDPKSGEKNYKSIENGELILKDSFGKELPLSVFVRLKR